MESIFLRLSRQCITFDTVSENDKLVVHLTGLPNSILFDIILRLCEKLEFKYYMGWKVDTISPKEQLFITLCDALQN